MTNPIHPLRITGHILLSWTLYTVIKYLNVVIKNKVMTIWNTNCCGTTPMWYLWHVKVCKGNNLLLIRASSRVKHWSKVSGGRAIDMQDAFRDPTKAIFVTECSATWRRDTDSDASKPSSCIYAFFFFFILCKIENETPQTFTYTWGNL